MDLWAINLLDELKIRRDARLNYVPLADRRSLHPIAREEMEDMDRDSPREPIVVKLNPEPQPVADANQYEDLSIGKRFVPLLDTTFCRVDTGEMALHGPHFHTAAGKHSTSRFAEDHHPAL